MRVPAALLLSFLFVSPARAQTQSPQPPTAPSPAEARAAQTTAPAGSAIAAVNPAKAADIRKLLEVSGAKSMMSQVMTSMEKNIKPVLTRSLPPGEYQAKLIDLFFDKFMARINLQIPVMLESSIPIYDKYLSDDDIKGMIQFYQTPVGKKALSVLPQITAELQAQGAKMGEGIGRESMLEVLAEHPELKKAMDDARTAPAH